MEHGCLELGALGKVLARRCGRLGGFYWCGANLAISHLSNLL